MSEWASLSLRIALGVIFMAHGSQKAFGLFGGPGVEGFSRMLAGLGFSPPIFWSYVGACTELIGGTCLLLGLFTKTAASFILIFMIVATLKVHLKKGLFMSAGGFEYNLLIIAACIALLILGGGNLSITKKW